MPSKHHTTFCASDGALIHLTSSLPLTSPDPSYIPTSPILTFSGPTGTSTSATAPVSSSSGTAGSRARSASKASVVAEEGPNYSRLVLLLHGFSGSAEYFDRNWEQLSSKHWVVGWDMRGHGRSGLRKRTAGEECDSDGLEEGDGGKEEERLKDVDAGKRAEGTEGQKLNSESEGVKDESKTENKTKKKAKYQTYSGGYHVARLAMDLKNMVDFLKSTRLRSSPTNPLPPSLPLPPLEIVAVGCSIGAAILWTYIELFGDSNFSGFVFVDQAPLQDRSLFGGWDATKAHKGCFNEETMLGAQKAWDKPAEERHGTHVALVEECLGYRFQPLPSDNISDEQRQKDEEFFTRISAQCPSGEWLAKLIADHTRYDHREACEVITKPVLVMGGKRSGCFSLEGMEEVAKRARRGGNERCEVSWYESGHWLFWEEAERFNEEVLGFVRRCWSE